MLSPAFQEFKGHRQLLLPLYEGLSERSLRIEHLGRRADDNRVETLDGKPVRLRADLRRGVINPVVVEYLLIVVRGFFLTR